MASEMIFDKFLEYNDLNSTPSLPYANVPTQFLTLIGLYLLFVLKLGPSYMKSRPAYNLKTFIVIYNIFQVIACTYLIYKITKIDLPTLTFWQCIVPDPGTELEKEFSWICLFTVWLKATELSETVVFVLRKKQRQVSFLHVFHHCTTLFLAFQADTIYRASSAFYPVFLNSGVHVFMYTYYLMAAVLPPHVVAKLTPVKKAITTIQMIQFGLILLQVVIGLSCGCKVPSVVLTLYVLIISAFSYMFYDFYKKNYTLKQQKQAQS